MNNLRESLKIFGLLTLANLTLDSLKKIYMTLAKSTHPDKNPGKDTNEQMKAINGAYTFLKDIIEKPEFPSTFSAREAKGARAPNAQRRTRTHTDSEYPYYDSSSDFNSDSEYEEEVSHQPPMYDEATRKIINEQAQQIFQRLFREPVIDTTQRLLAE